MELTFTKMHGLGNDFVLIDSRDMDLSEPLYHDRAREEAL